MSELATTPTAAVFHGLVRTMAAVLDADDGWPASHAGRVALVTRRIATTMGLADVAVPYYAALLHDLGGSGLDEHITAHAERAFTEPSAQAHPRLGAELISTCSVLAPVRGLVELHHERADGTGFPFGRAGDDVPAAASIIGLADAIELGLRMAGAADRRVALAATLHDQARGAAPQPLIDAAWATFAGDADLLDALFDPGALAVAHATPAPGFPGLAGLEPVELVTPLAMLLARLVDGRSHRTRGHSTRVAYLGFQIAHALGPDVVDPWDVAWAGLLHGVGWTALARRTLDRLDFAEPGLQARVARRADDLVVALPGLSYLAHAVTALHAHSDGNGVPGGLRGEQIPLVARILGYADSYDQLTSYQTARGPLAHPSALAAVRDQVGTVLDPHLAELALATLDRVAALRPEPPTPDDWRAYFEVRPGPPVVVPAPTAPRPVGRGALLVDLEPWQAATATATLAVVDGGPALAAIFGRPVDAGLGAVLSAPSEAELRTLVDAALRSGTIGTCYVFTPDGRPAEVVVTPAGDGVRLLVRGATNRLQTLDRLALFYRNFLASSEGVVFADPTGRIIDVNRAFLDLFGYSLREVIGQHTRILKSGHQSDAFYRQMWTAISDPAGGTWAGELIDRRRDGRELHVQMRISAVRDASGGCIGYIAHHQDISERKRAEAELMRRDAELVRKNAELERLNQFKTDMVAVTSHDLKSPLASIVGVAGLLSKNLDRLPSERVVAYLDRIADTARNLTSFINDLLDLEKIESGALTLDRVPVHLDQLLHDAAEQARGAAQGRISLEVTAAAGPAVMADPTRLEQVIANLVANACKFAPDGSAVTLTLRLDGVARVRLEVADRGPGVPAGQLDAIFERYYQAERKGGTPKRGSGSGLGLSIVRSLVELHGGRVWAENRAGGGCRFVVELPSHHDDPMLRRPVVLVVSSLTAEAMEVTEHLLAAGAVVRRIESVPELRRLLRVLQPPLVLVARAQLDAEVIGCLELPTGAVRPTLVVLDDDQGGSGGGLLDNVLTPPVLPDEVRALVRRAMAVPS